MSIFIRRTRRAVRLTLNLLKSRWYSLAAGAFLLWLKAMNALHGFGIRKRRVPPETVMQFIGMLRVPGSSTKRAKLYHELPFPEFNDSTHRSQIDKRLAIINDHYDVFQKKGVDLGCSVGGFVFALQLKGARMTGIDYDPVVIEFAKSVESIKQTGARFVHESIDQETVRTFGDTTDFVIWFSQFMWLVKSLGEEQALDVMFAISKDTRDIMFFETSVGDAGAGEEMRRMGIVDAAAVKQLLTRNTVFQNINCLGNAEDGWADRPIYVCRNPQFLWNGITSVVERIDRRRVRKSYFTEETKIPFRECKRYESMALQRLGGAHFPTILEHVSDTEFIMEYAGNRLSKDTMPADYQEQVAEILQELARSGVRHNDILPANLLIKDGIITLVDFGWATIDDQPARRLPDKVGGFCRNEGEPDDTISMQRSIEHLLQ